MALSSTTEELFRIWQTHCVSLSANVNSTESPKISSIQSKVRAAQTEGRNFFASLVSGTSLQVGSTVLTTRPSHTDSLALLIQTLEPCFAASSTLVSRWAALSCLVGSIQGCQQAVAAPMTLPLLELLSTFLLRHAGPLASSADEDDQVDRGIGIGIDEHIRDTAITGLCALVKCRTVDPTAAVLPSMEVDGAEDESQAGRPPLYSTLTLRLTVAKSGVEQRCAQDSNDNDGYSRSTSMAAGLSMLPRSRRSLCFDLVQAAVEGVAANESSGISVIDNPQSRTVLMDSVEFCKFAASLLHGESDPRCLLQLLTLFDSMQQSFTFLASHFPNSELFDAVAPYYPIQFNPPPNDVHGITRASLRQAVVRILSCSRYDAGRHYDDNMISLSFGLMVEALVPPPEDGPLTYQEQIDALEDLQAFLLSIRGTDQEANCDKLDDVEIRRLSDSLQSVHETSSLAVSRGEESALAKAVAELCRTLVAQIAAHLERSVNVTRWMTFVQEPVRALSTRQDSSPSGRIATAYLACLASCGGTKTVRISIDAGLAQLFKRLEGDSDANTTASCLYGIGAFFSSCRVAMERASQDGIMLHPHPLQSHADQAMDHICASLLSDKAECESSASSLRIAAVRAFESVLLVSPMPLFASDRMDRILAAAQSISSRLLLINEMGSAADVELGSASSITIGTLLGKALDSKDASEADSDDRAIPLPRLASFLLQDFLPALLASVRIQQANQPSPSRGDHKTLAIATAFSMASATHTVHSLAETLHVALIGSNYANARSIAETLAFLFSLKDGFAAKAYQAMSPPSVTAFGIMMALVPAPPDKDDGIEADFGMSNLQLPKTNEDRQKALETLENANDIIRFLRKGYEFGIPEANFAQLVSHVSRLLPPLNDVDVVQLSTALPFLSAAMEGSISSAASQATRDELRGMGRDLVEFATTAEYIAPARSYAARCLHEIVATFTPRNAQLCPAQELIAFLLNTMRESVNSMKQEHDGEEDMERTVSLFADCLNVMAVLGSAAARRGGPSSKTSDHVVMFLIDLACKSKASYPMVDDVQEHEPIQLQPFATYAQDEPTKLSMQSASAFGSILSASAVNSLWQQRLTHVSFNRIMEYLHTSDVSNTGNSSLYCSPGLLSTLCHAICASNLSHVASVNMATAAKALTSSLSPPSLSAARQADTTMPELILAALLKLLSASPASFPNAYPLITGSLHAFATAADLEQGSEVACKVLALQLIAGVSQMDKSGEALKSLKPAVVSLLSTATNHPSGLLRIAAGEVRNAWFFID